MCEKQTKTLQLEAYVLLEEWGRVSATNPLLAFANAYFFRPQGIQCDFLEFDFIAAAEDHVIHRLARPQVRLGYAEPEALQPYQKLLSDLKRVHPYFLTEVDSRGIITAKCNLTRLAEVSIKEKSLIEVLRDQKAHTALSTRIQHEAQAFLLCIVDEIFLSPAPDALKALVCADLQTFYTLTFEHLDEAITHVTEAAPLAPSGNSTDNHQAQN